MPMLHMENGNFRRKFQYPSKFKSPTSDIWDVNRPLYRQWGKLDRLQGGSLWLSAVVHRQRFIQVRLLSSVCI